MPSVAVKLYSVFFKFLLKHRLQSRIQAAAGAGSPFGVTSRPEEETIAAANPSFGADGVATKDIHIDPLTSLSLRIFLPDSCLGGPAAAAAGSEHGGYRGYAPANLAEGAARKLPIVLQFHGGGFVSGSNDSAANDFFCRRVAKLCDVIVIAVGYRLAPENRYPAAFEDGLKALNWLGKQANLAECGKSMGNVRVGGGGGGGGGGGDVRKTYVVDAFGASMVEPWLAAHGDPSRFVFYFIPHLKNLPCLDMLFSILLVAVCYSLDQKLACIGI